MSDIFLYSCPLASLTASFTTTTIITIIITIVTIIIISLINTADKTQPWQVMNN